MPHTDPYVTLDEAEEFFEFRLHKSSWDDADDDSKLAALVMASDDLRTFTWSEDEDIDEDAPPQWLKDATCELALVHITQDVTALNDVQSGAVKRKKVGPLETEYAIPAERALTSWDRFPRFWMIVEPHMGGGGQPEIVRG